MLGAVSLSWRSWISLLDINTSHVPKAILTLLPGTMSLEVYLSSSAGCIQNEGQMPSSSVKQIEQQVECFSFFPCGPFFFFLKNEFQLANRV